MRTDYPLIVAQGGQFDGQRWIIKDTLVIGRDEECDIVIPSQQVSRFHAKLTLTEQGVILEDLGSKNGSYHNGQLITAPTLLKEEDVFQISLAQQFTLLNADVTLPVKISAEDDKHFFEAKEKPHLRLDKRSHKVWVGDKEIKPPLSLLQFKLLEILYQNYGKVVPRRDIIAYVWGEENIAGVTEQALDALVRRLRERIMEIDPNHSYITTVRGHGLMLN